MKSLEYAAGLAASVMSAYPPKVLPPAMHFHYHQGIFLEGALQLCKINGDKRIYEYIKEWVDIFVAEDGSIKNCTLTEFDDIEPGNLIFYLYAKTGEERYKRVLRLFANTIAAWPVNSEGAVWHKYSRRNQIWLDSMYMMGVFAARYAFEFDRAELFEPVYTLMCQIKKHMTDSQNGLLYHMYDETRKMFFTDKKTGLIPIHWGRAQGWFAAALADILDIMPRDNPHYNEVRNEFVSVINAVFKFQDEKTGMFYQVTDMPENPKNWLEASCTSLFAYAALKGLRLGILDEALKPAAIRAYEGALRNIEFKDGVPSLKNVCVGTGVGPLGYYFDRPTSENDLHGAGTFIMMCCEAHIAGE